MIIVSTNAKQVGASIDQVRKQIPFALSVALNDTAKDFQKEQRAGMAQRFTLRRKSWADRSIKISKFAKKRDPVAEVRVQTPGDPSRSDVLTQHEDGGTKTPKGSRLATPIDVRRTKTGVVSKTLRPRALEFKETGPNVYQGKRRTIMVKKPGGRGVILQRTGRKGKSAVRVLWAFIPRAQLKPRLKFHDTARAVFEKKAQGHFDAALRRALRTAR